MNKRLLFVFCVVISFTSLSQQKYQSLLWEITGNGLEKTSYLYGTMHVSKKIAFRLDDVFYKALNDSDCIGLESDPATWPAYNYDLMVANFSNYNYNDDMPYGLLGDSFYSDLFRIVHPSEMELRNSIRMDNTIINNYLYRKNSFSDNFEEETYLDMFIYQAGKKNNKEIIGLEDLAESKYLVTKALYSEQKKEVAPWLQKLFAKENSFLIEENLYRDRNLDLLDSIGEAVNTSYYRKNMLFIRNENMVTSLDSVMRKKSVFAGVGAAHLPGKNGIINMLIKKGYTVKALESEQTEYSKNEKNKLDNLFLAPKLSRHTTPDGFLSIKSIDKLREFSFGNQKYYLDPDVTNGSYLTINRINTFDYLPNDLRISLDKIDNLLYEDIPGDIIKKEKITAPYPGISILNKTKKGDYQKYHIYKTPLEIVIIKFGGKRDYVLKYEKEIFNSIVFKKNDTEHRNISLPNLKYKVLFPNYYVSDNFDNSGKKLLQGFDNDAYYFLLESPIQDINYTEDDAFEAKYIHDAFYKNLKTEQIEGHFNNNSYKSYESYANTKNDLSLKIHLKTIVKDGSYFLLGYVGNNLIKQQSFFKSFTYKKIDYSNFKKVVDTSLHFSVYTNTKQPTPEFYTSSNRLKKDYEESIKHTSYSSKSNEKIYIRRTKFHDLQMYHNLDSLWSSLERKSLYDNGAKNSYTISNKNKNSINETSSYSFSLTHPSSSKIILTKNILRKGVLFELKTLIDSIAKPSLFIENFYNSFSPVDSLLGKDVLKDKTTVFFKALRENDSLVLNSYSKIKFKPHNAEEIIDALDHFDFPKDKNHIKSYLVRELSKLKNKNTPSFLKQLYVQSYSDPRTQTTILKALLNQKNKSSYKLFAELMEIDLPLSSREVKSIFVNYKDSIELKRTLFPKLLNHLSIQEYKNPIYSLLAKVKDSGLINPKAYKDYKYQIIKDGKIQIKRSLSKNKFAANSLTHELSNYVKLIFPYRKEKSAMQFFETLLNSDDVQALSTYFVLLKKAQEKIPLKLSKKTIDNLENIWLTIEKLESQGLLETISDKKITQKQFVKSKLISFIDYEKDNDSISFLAQKEFKTDDNKVYNIYFYKLKQKKKSYGNSNYLHYLVFSKNKANSLTLKHYFKSAYSGIPIDQTKTDEEQFQDVINLAKHKTRKRINNSGNRNTYSNNF